MKTLREIKAALSKYRQDNISARAAELITMTKLRKLIDTAWLIIRAPFICVLMCFEATWKIALWPFKKIYNWLDDRIDFIDAIAIGFIFGLGFWAAELILDIPQRILWSIF